MKSHKKSLIASIVAFALGISCCWISALAIWLGGVGVLGVFLNTIKDFQAQLIILGLVFLIFTIYLFRKNKRSKQ
jgi:DMSO/TMAO reductase YedYZ heme-binding membrane subunit